MDDEDDKGFPLQQEGGKKVHVTYENQRIWLGIWTNKLFPGERSNWSDVNGMLTLPKEGFKLAEGWEWEDIWHVEKLPEFTDNEGWQTAVDFNGNWHGSKGLFDAVRRKKWLRLSKQI